MRKTISIAFMLIIMVTISFGGEKDNNKKSFFGLETAELNCSSSDNIARIGTIYWSDDSTSVGGLVEGYAQSQMDGNGNVESYASTIAEDASYIEVNITMGGYYSFNSANNARFVWTTLEVPYWNLCSCTAHHMAIVNNVDYRCTTVVDGADNDL